MDTCLPIGCILKNFKGFMAFIQSICVSATICSSLSNLEGEETFEASLLGQAEEVVQERVCDDELILIKK